MGTLDLIGEQRERVATLRRAGSDSEIVATDGELLMRFTRHGDQRAFAQIVERHGGLVWIVCREVLGHSHDVEDAFQATFIILAERAATIRGSNSAVAWLCKVAKRTSLAARRKRARLREESLAVDPRQMEPEELALPDRELVYVLFDELRRLPERYQTPLVLRYMEGQSRRAIANQTDSTVAQIQGRLVRGRRMLRSRMLRRGVSLSLAAGAVAAAGSEASAAVTPTLAAVTAAGCLTLKKTGAVVGFSATALQLAKQGAKVMWLASMMKTAAVLSTAVTTLAIAYAVEKGGGAQAGVAERNGNQNRIEVRAASSDEAPRERLGIASSANDEAEKAAAAEANGKRLADLAKRKTELMQGLDSTLQNKTKLAAHAGLRDVNKSLLQRELEQLQDAKLRLEIDTSDDKDTARRDAMIEKLEARMSDCRHRLEKQAEDAATMQAEVERLEGIAVQTREAISGLERIALETTFTATRLHAAESPVSGVFMAPSVTNAPPTINGTIATTSAVSGVRSGEATLTIMDQSNQISAGDGLLIRALNAFPEQPINDVFYVEPTGTVALGPGYGRVDVAGLSVLEAEEAITKHLATIIKNPEIQVTLAAKARTQTAAGVVPEYPIGPAVALSPQLGRHYLNFSNESPSNFDQVLLQKIDAMASTVQELQAELAGLKKRSQNESTTTPASR